MADYIYCEEPANPGSPLLILLHGTGGSEYDLIEFGRQVMPGAHLISPRGDVSENGAPRYFRRLGMGIFDMPDLERATAKLAKFIGDHTDRLRPSLIAALGYSNGANVLSSVLFSAPGLIDRSVLMHPLIPFVPPPQPALKNHRVLITAGRNDPIVPWQQTAALALYFEEQGAATELTTHDGGHQLQRAEVAAAKRFLGA